MSCYPPEPTSQRGGRVAALTQLPLTRVKNIIKSDPDITLAGQEAVLLIAKVQSLYHTTIPCQ